LRLSATLVGLLLLASAEARAQAPPPGGGWGGQWQAPPPAGPGPYAPGPYGYGPPPYQPPVRSPKRTDIEIGALYAVSVAYGAGMGIWLSAEMGIEDPAIFLIPPALLGVAAPVGVWWLDDPEMPSGLPASMAAGAAIGAGEGIGIASYQFVSTDEDEAWGFRGLSRATALGATAGGIGGYAVGYYLEPSPKSTLFVSSATLWGTAIGTMFGYGASEAGVGYGIANDSAGLGGLIGFNLALAGSAAASTVFIPSWDQLGWMWAGGGIGAAVSLPIFLFYAGGDEDGPPAKRGFLFMGTATTLGIIAGGVFASGELDEYEIGSRDGLPGPRRPATLAYVTPLPVAGGAGLAVGGLLY